MIRDDVLIISNHHRPVPLFTLSIEKLWNGGYQNIWIQDTCIEPWARYPGKASKKFGGDAHLNYFQGMQSYKRLLSGLPNSIEYLLLIDNDLFIRDVQVVDKYLRLFENGNYDFASCYTHPDFYSLNPHSFEEDFLAVVPVQEIYTESPDLDLCNRSGLCPFIFPWPYWENAFQITRRSMWDKLTKDDVSHGRKYIKALVREKAKLAVLKTLYRVEEEGIGGGRFITEKGDGWFHLGDLMYFYYAAEEISRLKEYDRVVSNSYVKSRIGCLLNNMDRLPQNVQNGLTVIASQIGGEGSCIAEWESLVQGTFLSSKDSLVYDLEKWR